MEDSILGLAELQAENRPVELGKHWGILGGGGRALSQSGDKLTWQGRKIKHPIRDAFPEHRVLNLR